MSPKEQPSDETATPGEDPATSNSAKPDAGPRVRELGGPKGLEPTRYGDWERKGRCVDF